MGTPSPPILQDGVYTITKAQGNLRATLQSVTAGTNVVLLAPITKGGGVSQRWEVKRASKSKQTYTIKNQGTFLSFDGSPAQGKPVSGYPTPTREWTLYKAVDAQAYHVVVPGGPINGKELAFDRASRQVTPPWTALENLDVKDQSQAWILKPV